MKINNSRGRNQVEYRQGHIKKYIKQIVKTLFYTLNVLTVPNRLSREDILLMKHLLGEPDPSFCQSLLIQG